MNETEQASSKGQGQPDDSEPGPERQVELEAAYEANVAAGDPPYKGVRIRTYGELRWVMEKRRWSGTFRMPEGYERANLSSADLSEATLSNVDLRGATLSNAKLSGSHMDVTTSLTRVTLDRAVRLADVIWNNVPLTRISWDILPRLGDEVVARERKDENGKRKDASTRLDEYQAAVRSYRRLAVALRDQGLNEDADRYAYRAQLMQRVVLRRQTFLKGRRVGPFHRFRYLMAYLGSELLDLIAGYGYRPGRSIATYAITILVFEALYWCVTNDVSLTHGGSPTPSPCLG